MNTDAQGLKQTNSVHTAELLDRVRDGDSDAASRLLARYLPLLQRWAHRRLPRWARGVMDTADLVQQTVLQVIPRLPGFTPHDDGALLRYLRRALSNRIRDHYRQVARRPEHASLDEQQPDGSESPFDVVANDEARMRYAKALSKVRDADRQAIVARIELGCSYEQLAVVLGKPTAQAARLAVRRALLRLAREF